MKAREVKPGLQRKYLNLKEKSNAFSKKFRADYLNSCTQPLIVTGFAFFCADSK